MPSAVLVLALLLAPGLAAAQCCGDCNDDGQVAINELITAVNNSLDGCDAGPTPTPTEPPTQCPVDFRDDNTQPGTPDCYYRGRWNPSCGAADLEALWRSDGEFVVVELLGFEPGLFFGAEVTAPGAADIICWFTQDDASDCDGDKLIGGTLSLASGGGTLTAQPQPSPFSLEGCAFTRYGGALIDVVTPAGAAAVRRERRDTTALQRLRETAAGRRGREDFRRRGAVEKNVD